MKPPDRQKIHRIVEGVNERNALRAAARKHLRESRQRRAKVMAAIRSKRLGSPEDAELLFREMGEEPKTDRRFGTIVVRSEGYPAPVFGPDGSMIGFERA